MATIAGVPSQLGQPPKPGFTQGRAMFRCSQQGSHARHSSAHFICLITNLTPRLLMSRYTVTRPLILAIRSSGLSPLQVIHQEVFVTGSSTEACECCSRAT